MLRRDGFAVLRDQRVAIVANQSSVGADGERSIDLLAQRKDVFLTKIFSPEHGLQGTADTRVGDSRDERTGLAVHSLYGETFKPTAEHMHGLDAVL